MEIKHIRTILERAERFWRKNAKPEEADALGALCDTLQRSDRRTIDEFIRDAEDALRNPIEGKLPEDIARDLTAARTDRTRFTRIYDALSNNTASKDLVKEVAAAYTGVRLSAKSSKATALKAIQAFFDQRAYLSAKADAARKVTPF